jgi:RNA polymerase sigma-70 factor (ECF subfamily)
MEDRSDKALMKSITHGSKPAFKVLFNRYQHPLFNYILRHTSNRELAQDLLQETFIKVWTAAHTFDLRKGYFKGWIYTIALNTTRNELSKKQYAHHFLDVHEISGGFRDPGSSDHEHPDAQTESSDLQNRVARALNQLPPLMKEVVIMKNYQQLKFWEIAEITATPEGTLKARYHRAVGQLRELLSSRE